MNKTEYLLTILSEESAEVAHAACKAIRFGLADVKPGQQENNIRRLESELADLLAVAEMLGLRIHEVDKDAKIAKVKKFMEYSRKVGTLKD